ncbi:MAG: glycosyltransferase [Chlamydiota bacterium]|nr:glycosyltransferase [Chlamydiota bacterium]
MQSEDSLTSLFARGIKKIDFLLPITSQYHALHHFTRKIYEAFVRKGFSCRLIDANDHFGTPVKDPPDLTFGLNGAPFDENRRMLCDIIKVPHFSYLIDPPYRFYEILSSPYMYVGCDDRYCCKFLETVDFYRTSFLPHGVDINLSPQLEHQKQFDAVFLASFINYVDLRKEWMGYLPKIVSQTMDDAIDITFSDGQTSFIEAFKFAYKDRMGLKDDPKSIGKDFVLPLILLERYIKGKERTDLITSIPDTNVLLFNGHFKGQPGWESVLKDKHPNITLHDSVDYDTGVEMMKQSKVVLNSFSKNKEGAHDRVFNGLAAGALVLTNQNTFMDAYFSDEENILFYNPKDLSGINEKLKKYISDDSLREEAAEKGRDEVMTRHTWDHRVEDLIKSN